LHGAYEVTEIKNEKGSENFSSMKLKRLFIHRNNYLILQYLDDTIEDFILEINQERSEFILTN
jgi:hypothetical protein